jgi:hypothetical protein
MSIVQTWVVCEQSGRWVSALRLAIARRPNERLTPRLYEVRGLPELLSLLKERTIELSLVEVGRANLADVLELLAEGRLTRSSRNVALLDRSICETNSAERRAASDALWEAGAVDVVESPRNLVRLFALGERLADLSGKSGHNSLDRQAVAEWAWSLLPWQDA